MRKIVTLSMVLIFIVLLSSCAVSCSGYKEDVYEVNNTFRSIDVDELEAAIVITPSSVDTAAERIC